MAQRVSYDEFGIETENTNPGWQPFGYAGGLVDSQTGLIRFGARDYDPESGRWTSKDPIGFAGGTTSLYSYVANDPVNLTDPTGEVLPLVLIAAGAGIGAAINVVATIATSGGDITSRQIAAALVSGAIAGAVGAVGGPLGGTIARALGRSSAGLLATSATAGLSALGGAAGQAIANLIAPCNSSSVANAALFAGLGGAASASLFPVKGMYTLSQAQHFAPKLLPTINNSAFVNSAGTSAGVGAAAAFGGPFR